jgi:hypothetical protein
MRHGYAAILAILVSIGLMAACDEDPTGPDAGEPFTLAPGERVTLEPMGTHVRFLRVAEDSRCPLRAQCVWAGDGAVVFEIATRDGDSVEHTLHTNEGPKAVVIDSHELTLLQLNPHPELSGDIAPEDYRATLVLHKRQE